ncbi:hypothetical protein VTL71DRAFT_13406, partial [Oculimacula yallundae]
MALSCGLFHGGRKTTSRTTSLPAPNSRLETPPATARSTQGGKLGIRSLIRAHSDVYEEYKETGLVTLAARGRKDDAMTRLLVKNAAQNVAQRRYSTTS